MEKRKLGKTGLDVSLLGFGGAEIGFGGASRQLVEELLLGAFDAGVNVIDTAECYELSEERIGETVSHRRKDYYLFSKCGHSRGYDNPDWNDVSRLQASLDNSLKRLRTDHLDLFQLHSCSKEVLQKGDVMTFMKQAKASGKTRFIGYSGENEAAEFAIASGIFDTLQLSVNIADQHSIETIIPSATRAGMGIIAKRPIANAAWKQHHRPEGYIANYWERLQKLSYDFLANEGAVEMALRFTLSVPGVSMALVGTMQPGRHAEDVAMAVKGPLASSQYSSIRQRWQAVAEPSWMGEI